MNPTLMSFVPALLALAGQAKNVLQYDGWADHKVGASVTLKMETDSGGFKIGQECTLKLLELSAEQAVVEEKKKLIVAGKAEPEMTDKIAFHKNKEKYPIKVDKEGEEEIEVAGKKLQCHWVEGSADGKTKTKIWYSKEIPGGLAKGVFGAPDAGGMTITVAAWEKK